MTDEECRQLYEQLVQLLQGSEINWVTELSRQEIGLGKLIKQREEYGLTSGSGSGPRSSRRGQKSLMTVEYTERERLRILLTFIRKAVVDTTLLEIRIIDYFEDSSIFSQEISTVRFVDGENDPYSHTLSRGNSEIREYHARRLNDLIDEILREIDNDPER